MLGKEGPFSCYMVDDRACVGSGDDSSSQYCSDLFVGHLSKKPRASPPSEPTKPPSEKMGKAPAKEGKDKENKETKTSRSSALKDSCAFASRPVQLKGMSPKGGT